MDNRKAVTFTTCQKFSPPQSVAKKRNSYFNLIENTNVNSAIYNKYFKEKSIESINFNYIYTQISKKIYPLIINPFLTAIRLIIVPIKKTFLFFALNVIQIFAFNANLIIRNIHFKVSKK